MTDILRYFKNIESDLITYRRSLHSRAEVGFNLKKTVKYVKDVLTEIGYNPIDIGNNGVYVVVGNGTEKFILLRADIDALPIIEESGLPFCSVENMHACGHDMHAAILLGVARYLKSIESSLKRPIKLLFQPAEEILCGAINMIEHGILEGVESAFMIHVMVNTSLNSGTLVVSDGGISAPATKYFEIEVTGKGCHGAMPNTGIDPIVTAANIITMLDSIKSRELSIYDNAVLTIGSVIAGNSHNVIPSSAKICGTFRAFDKSVVSLIEESILRICKNTAKALRCNAEVTFPMGAPCLNNDNRLSETAAKILKSAFSDNFVTTSSELSKRFNTSSKSTGSEDFAYYSEKVPSLMIGLAAGNLNEGYNYPLHHSKAKFDESALVYGAAALSEIATKI